MLRIFLNNPFITPLVHHTAAIRCLDMSRSRGKLALVDEHSSLYVYDCAQGGGSVKRAQRRKRGLECRL